MTPADRSSDQAADSGQSPGAAVSMVSKDVEANPTAVNEEADSAPGKPDDIETEFDNFYRANFPKLRGMLFTRCRDWSMAENMTQEVMIICHRKWPALRGTQPHRFAVTVALRLLSRMDIIMARRLEEPLGELESVVPRARDLLANGGVDTALVERITVEGAIRALPSRQGQIITLYYKFGYSIDEIATELDIRPGTVKSHLYSGRRKLAELLEADQSQEVRQDR